MKKKNGGFAEFSGGPLNRLRYGFVYDFLRPENQGKKIYVCNSSACMTTGTQKSVRQGRRALQDRMK